ncbi:MAG: histidine phosphatase family protein [Chitinophagales bacterium]|nr:histidine phosphatase family protein [Chitinophagales bacterium]
MNIGLIRHGRVLYRDPFFSIGESFNNYRTAYDESEILNPTLKISANDFPVCYVSSKKRALDTVKAIYDGDFKITDELVEVPNIAFFLLKLNLPSSLRSILGRIAWFINYHKMPETRRQSNLRAYKFLTQLVSENRENVLLVTHGFFMQSLRHELKKLNFKGKCPINPANATLYIFRKN